jgi:hypothetical protein
MREVLLLAIHLLVTLAKLLRPGGIRAVAAESLLLKHQILIGNRARRRGPNLTTVDRVVLGLTTLFVNPRRIPKLGALVKPATLYKFHRALVDQKYRLLFSSSANRRTPGPKGPSPALIAAIVEMKQRNPRFGCVRIAQQIADAFGVELDKDVVRRVLAKHYRPGDSGSNGPSWLTFIETRDSLWRFYGSCQPRHESLWIEFCLVGIDRPCNTRDATREYDEHRGTREALGAMVLVERFPDLRFGRRHGGQVEQSAQFGRAALR